MSAGITHLTDATFAEEVMSSEVPVLVDFWAEWCQPCKMIAPILEELVDDHGDKIRVVKLDIESNPAVTRQYDVQSIPTLLLFNDGEIEQRLIGARGKAQLVEQLADYL